MIFEYFWKSEEVSVNPGSWRRGLLSKIDNTVNKIERIVWQADQDSQISKLYRFYID
jgi:hypothetical protein